MLKISINLGLILLNVYTFILVGPQGIALSRTYNAVKVVP